ncbi:MAG: hypothetical protein NC389_16930, partial [Acetatifactor muris]|nr:hypothetical protein [Acetatifactor muris]
MKISCLTKLYDCCHKEKIPNTRFPTEHNTNEFLLQRCNPHDSNTNSGKALKSRYSLGICTCCHGAGNTERSLFHETNEYATLQSGMLPTKKTNNERSV